MARLLRFAAVAVLVGGATAGLSGCTGDADPVGSPSPSVTVESPSPMPSASPSPTALSDEELLELIPEDARAENFGAASNFAKFFVLESQKILVDGDDGLFRAVSEPGCTFCIASLATLEAMREQGLTARGGEIAVSSELASGGLQADGTWNASFDIDVSAQEFVDETGTVIASNPAESLRVGVVLRYNGSVWGVVDVGSEPR